MVNQATSSVIASARNTHGRIALKPALKAIHTQLTLLEADHMAMHQAFMPEGTQPRTNAAIIDEAEVEDVRYAEVRHTLANILMRYAMVFDSSFAETSRKVQDQELRSVIARYDADIKQSVQQRLAASIEGCELPSARKLAAQKALAAFFTHHTAIVDTAKSLLGGRAAAIGLVS